jgi:hypothetical protein
MEYITKAIEFTKLFILSPKALDVTIDTFSKQSTLMGENALDEQQKAHLRQLFTSDDFLRTFSTKVQEIFSEDELTHLIQIYKLDVMKKIHQHGAELTGPVYIAMKKQVDEITKNAKN